MLGLGSTCTPKKLPSRRLIWGHKQHSNSGFGAVLDPIQKRYFEEPNQETIRRRSPKRVASVVATGTPCARALNCKQCEPLTIAWVLVRGFKETPLSTTDP